MEHYRGAYGTSVITNASLVNQLEAAVAERLPVKYCVAVSSCTSGLMMVLRALGLTGEIIIPSFTFFATGHAALWNGLRPVFADCNPDTWNVDPADVERKITKSTSAILVVHLYGNPANVDALERLASRHGLKLIFDAATGSAVSIGVVRLGNLAMQKSSLCHRRSCWSPARVDWSPQTI